jgi:dTDP-4-dehydrorhamnose reductase
MRILVFGGKGMLGHKLVQTLGEKLEVWATLHGDFSEVERFGIFDRNRTIESVDVADTGAVCRAIEDVKPDVVINAVGIIKQLPAAKDADQALSINSVFPHRLAALAAKYGFRLITISTDCVFSGDRGAYSETDIPDARDLYGISKLLGEVGGVQCLTLRTSIIGRELGTGHSVVEWFLKNRGKSVNGYVNAIYTGFPTAVLARIILDLILEHPVLHGIYHVSSEPISKFDLLNLLNSHFAADARIARFEDYVVNRSLDSTRFRSATGFEPAGWEQMIGQMAADPTPYQEWSH